MPTPENCPGMFKGTSLEFIDPDAFPSEHLGIIQSIRCSLGIHETREEDVYYTSAEFEINHSTKETRFKGISTNKYVVEKCIYCRKEF